MIRYTKKKWRSIVNSDLQKMGHTWEEDCVKRQSTLDISHVDQNASVWVYVLDKFMSFNSK